MKKLKTPKTSLIKIADVLKTGDRLSTGERGAMHCRVPGLEIAIRSAPADDKLGGDFHGAIYLQEDRTAVFVGDIAGHDFSAGILAASVMEFIEQNQDALLAPNHFLGDMTRALHRDLASIGRFFTFAVCLIHTEKGVLEYASAGHPPALFYSRVRDRVDPVGRKSLPVGFEKEVEFALVRREFLPGDRLLMYTDGISSARNAQNEEFGQRRLERVLVEHRDAPSRVIAGIIDALAPFAYDEGHRDDQTLLLAARV